MPKKNEPDLPADPLFARLTGRGARSDFARKISVSPQALTNWETRGIPFAMLPRVAAAIGMTVEAYLELVGRSPQNVKKGQALAPGPWINRVPVISWVQAGDFADAVDNLHPGHADEWVGTSAPVNRHTYALRVEGDSMTSTSEPTFPAGTVIVVEPDAITEPAAMVGRFIIMKHHGETTFKKLSRDGGRYYLMPLNPQYPRLDIGEDDVCCGVVREKVTRFF